MQVEDAIKEGAIVRFRPVLMTALVAIMGLLPKIFSQGTGSEVQRPLATVVLGGLVSATLLTLMVLPVMHKLTTKDNDGHSSDEASDESPDKQVSEENVELPDSLPYPQTLVNSGLSEK